MALFISTSVHRVDKKGRVSVPAAFRAALEGESFRGVVLTPPLSELPCVEGSGMSRIEAMAGSINRMRPNSQERDALADHLLAASVQAGFDGEGRIVLSEATIAEIGLEGEALFAGLGDKFQIWRPAAYEEHRARTKTVALDNLGRLPWGRDAAGSNGEE